MCVWMGGSVCLCEQVCVLQLWFSGLLGGKHTLTPLTEVLESCFDSLVVVVCSFMLPGEIKLLVR